MSRGIGLLRLFRLNLEDLEKHWTNQQTALLQIDRKSRQKVPTSHRSLRASVGCYDPVRFTDAAIRSSHSCNTNAKAFEEVHTHEQVRNPKTRRENDSGTCADLTDD